MESLCQHNLSQFFWICCLCFWDECFLSLTLSVDGFLIFTFWCSGPCSTVRLACALEWLSTIQVTVDDPGIVSYSLSSTEVLNLGLTSVSSDVSLSIRDLLWFVGSSCFFSAIRLLFIVFWWAQIEGLKCMFNVFHRVNVFSC